ncbi:MAG: hypothetical protein H8D38_04280 [DPANN group archaeon]|nr:hypothetical protein [DPANN group archaeon]
MSKKLLVLLGVIIIILSGCQYLKIEEGDMITGEVIEIPPSEDIVVDIEEPEDTYADILVRVEGVEGDLMTLKPDAYDPDGDVILYTFTEPFDKDGEWQTEEGDAGKYVVTVTASDGRLSTSEDVLVIIKPTNKAPVIECPDEMSFKEGDLVKLDCNIYDPEDTDVDVEYSGWLESDEYQATYEDEGEYEVTIKASDGERTSSKTIAITVNNLNRPPVVGDIDEITVEETEKVTLDIEASDLDGDKLTFRYSEPFDKDGEWETKLGDAGTYEAYVSVSDGTGMTRKEFTVVVTQKNTAPTLEFIPSIIVDEGETITLPINAYDREGDELTITVSGWFETETYITTFEDAGNHTVTVTVSDGELSGSQEVEIVVNDINRPPVFKIPA